jgi:hypothetical protein
MQFFRMVAIRGTMPKGGKNEVEIAVCSIPALLAMKGYALKGRYKQKDAYDIYYCVRNYPEGIDALAAACRPLLEPDPSKSHKGLLSAAPVDDASRHAVAASTGRARIKRLDRNVARGSRMSSVR